MKLMVCHTCNDILALRPEWRSCACGQTSGRYVDDLDAVVWGEPGQFCAVGFRNGELARAIREQREHGDLPPSDRFGGFPPGRVFEAFLLPVDCPSVRYLFNANQLDIPPEGAR